MVRSRFIVAVAAAVAVALVAGCGGPIQRDELERAISSLESAAADGQLLAHEVAADRSKDTFTRVHARGLAERVTHEAEKLQDAAGSSDTAAHKRKAVKLAQSIVGALGDLQVAPGDRAVARDVEHRLHHATLTAKALETAL
jgi:ATP phosphoribosyltransferase regulatory subunit HisZ